MPSDIKKIIPEIRENVDLSKYTTFKIGGPAKYFLEINNKEQLLSYFKAIVELKIPFFVLGGGSNTLVSDDGFDGLVIRIFGTGSQPEIKKNDDHAIVKAFSGSLLQGIILQTINNGLKGLEWASGIPGTIGGAVADNSGAFGAEIGNCVVGVTALMPDEGLKNFTKAECKFSYRESIFKSQKKLIIVEVQLKLPFADNKDEALASMKEKINYRNLHSPKFPNAGCVFKNITNRKEISKILKVRPEILQMVEEKWGGKVSARFLIEDCGLIGTKVGNAAVSKEQANYLINLNNAKAEDVHNLIGLVMDKIFKKFGVKLEEEIVRFG